MKNNDNNIKMEYAQNELRIRHVTFTMLCPLHFAISLLPFFFSLLSFFFRGVVVVDVFFCCTVYVDYCS